MTQIIRFKGFRHLHSSARHWLREVGSFFLHYKAICIETFRFLPIRIKLSLIIGAIVITVVTIFGLIVLQSQKLALMQRMNQVSRILVQNLAEVTKGHLLLEEDEQIEEAVFRLKNTNIAGLRDVAIVNRKGKFVSAFDTEAKSQPISMAALLNIRAFTVFERRDRFDFYYPITTQRDEQDGSGVFLGLAIISFSKSSILAPIHRARNIAVGVALIVIISSMIGINLIARRMAYQIQLLSDGARRVASGNLDAKISVSSKDELGRLAHEFNYMVKELKEKLQMQKFVSKLTVDMIRDSVNANGGKREAVRKNVTVLFSDVRNFSALAERLAPEDIVRLVNVYFDLQTKIIERNDGEVDKFMGDQIMAIFQGKLMADNALRAAVEIQRRILLLNQKRQVRRRSTLEVGIGINLGPAVMGRMGSTNLMDYTVIGDVVNVAARLCSSAKAGQIITSSQVTNQMNGSYPTTRLNSISVKGRTQAVDVCEVDYDRDILL